MTKDFLTKPREFLIYRYAQNIHSSEYTKEEKKLIQTAKYDYFNSKKSQDFNKEAWAANCFIVAKKLKRELQSNHDY